MSETETWINQKKINGRLCQVDWRLIEVLKEVIVALRTSGTTAVDLDKLKSLLDEAEKISASVAIPDPPGCSPRERSAGPGTG